MQDHASEPTMGAREWAMLLVLSVLWGGSFFFNGIAVRDLPSFTLVWMRVASAAITLLIVLRLLGQRMPPERGVWLAFFGMGLLNNVLPFALIVWGQHRIASGLASILNAATPLFTVLVAHLLTPDEKLTPLKAAGLAVGFVGVVATVGPDATSGLGGDSLAELACLAAALSYAFAGVFGRRFKRMGVAPLATAAGQVSASTILLLPVMLLADRPWTLRCSARLDLGRRNGARTAVDGARLRDLFPHPGCSGRDQCPPRYAARPGQRHPARGARPR